MIVRLGTRGSPLALWQASEVARLLSGEGHEPKIVVVRTTGDIHTDIPLSAIGGKGLFIKELEEALRRNEIDAAVHSLKDVPSVIPEDFVLATPLQRGDPGDSWIHRKGIPLDECRPGTLIGTSAPRRRAQLESRYPQHRVEPIRGNVESRLRKMREGQYEAIILAAAGLRRLGLEHVITEPIPWMIPAAGQAIVAVETLAARQDVREALRWIDDAPASIAASIERGLLQRFASIIDCNSPVAVFCEPAEVTCRLQVFWRDPSSSKETTFTLEGDPSSLVDRAETRLRQELSI